MRKLNKRLLIVLIGLVVVAALVVVNLIKPKSSAKGLEVRTELIGTRKIEAWVRAPGKIQPVTKVQVSSNVIGRVAEIAVVEGQRVSRGDLLLRLDDEHYHSVVQQFRAQIDAAVAQESLATAELREAGQNRDRTESLAAKGLSSDQDLQAVRTRFDVASARLTAAREEVRRARAAFAQGEKDLRETVFLAPMDGVVTELNIKVGENVVTGTMNNPGTVILTLADLAAMEVVANVDETDVVAVRTGQPARVLVDALPDTVLEGSVTRVGQSGHGQTGATQEATNFEVAVLLGHPPGVLRPGMNADIEILTGKSDSALAVPLQSLTARSPTVVERWKARRANKQSENTKVDVPVDTTGPESRNLVEGVFLLEGGKAIFVPVTLGLRGETHVEVRGDLQKGQELVIGPYKALRKMVDQDKIRPQKKKKTVKAAQKGKEGAGEEEPGS